MMPTLWIGFDNVVSFIFGVVGYIFMQYLSYFVNFSQSITPNLWHVGMWKFELPVLICNILRLV